MNTRTTILAALLGTITMLVIFATTGAPAWVTATLGVFAAIEATALAFSPKKDRHDRK